jgi:hypothetical protein
MIPFGKPLSDIEESDLQSLIESSVQENDRVEFKRDMYGRTDEEVREMLRDIAAMANHRGGDIYIGVDEDEDAVATALPGVSAAGNVERIRASCLSNIAPRLNGLEARDIPLQNGDHAIVVRVPRSLSGPHLITFRGLYQFWKRHGRQKDKMSVDEIRLGFVERFEGETRMERLLAERRGRLARTIRDEPWLLLTATPIFHKQEVIDTREALMQNMISDPSEQLHVEYVLDCGRALPTLWGLRAESREGDRPRKYLELHRNGHLEFGSKHVIDLYPNPPSVRLNAKSLLASTVVFVKLFAAVLQQAQIAGPCAFALTILNARGLRLQVGDLTQFSERQWPDEPLEIEPLYAENLAVEEGPIVKTWNDRLWNAFGFTECSWLTEDGQLRAE